MRQTLSATDRLVVRKNLEISELNSRLARKDETLAELDEQIARLENEAAEYTQTKKLHYEALSEEIRGRNSSEAQELRWQQQLGDARSELEDAKATILAQGNKIRELERGYSFKPSPVESALRLEIGEVRAELEAYKQQPATDFEMPEPADILNQLKARRKKSRADLGDIEAVLGLLVGVAESSF